MLVLASDPDREGEAIAWHVLEMLKMEGALKRGIEVKRVVFHEITKSAVTRAMESPRDVSETLVNAYLARRALDYLIGFNLSPVLWRKLPGSKSAGRVQSAALRIICDREQEIDAFQSREYWTVEAQLSKDGARSTMSARLTHLNGEKLDQFSLNNELDASSAYKKVSETKLRVGSVKKRLVRRNPVAPYITSTLQQDASAKLGFGPTRTMSVSLLDRSNRSARFAFSYGNACWLYSFRLCFTPGNKTSSVAKPLLTFTPLNLRITVVTLVTSRSKIRTL